MTADFATCNDKRRRPNTYCRHRATGHKTKRLGLSSSHKALRRSALPQVLLNYRIAPQLFEVNGTEVPNDITLRPYRYGFLSLTCIRWRQGTQRAVTRLKFHWSRLLPPVQPLRVLGQSTLIPKICGGSLGRIRCHAVDLVLVVLLLAFSNAAFGGKKAPKFADPIDLPQTFEVDFQFAAKQRAQLGPQTEVRDDVAGRWSRSF
jgi:hypothetical protein